MQGKSKDKGRREEGKGGRREEIQHEVNAALVLVSTATCKKTMGWSQVKRAAKPYLAVLFYYIITFFSLGMIPSQSD
jgi:hypothetical protein